MSVKVKFEKADFPVGHSSLPLVTRAYQANCLGNYRRTSGHGLRVDTSGSAHVPLSKDAHCMLQVIEQMGLTLCQKVVIGTPLKKGISGGERKRVCVAMELLMQPVLLFLDEPTRCVWLQVQIHACMACVYACVSLRVAG